MKSLGKVIKKKIGKDSQLVKEKLEKAPFSQPLQNYVSKDNLKDDYALFKYYWDPKFTNGTPENDDNLIIMSTVDLGDKKRKASKKKSDKKKKNTSSKSVVPKKSKKTKKATSTKKEAQKAKPKAKLAKKTKDKKGKSKKDNNSKYILDEYTIWINSLTKKNSKTSSEVAKTSTSSPEVKSESQKASKPSTKKKTKKKTKDIKTTNKTKEKPSKRKVSKKVKTKKPKKKSELKKKIEDSIKSNEKIASLSLAKLYESQGHYKKAIKVYKALNLINPKKSSFFAAQIKDLKKKL